MKYEYSSPFSIGCFFFRNVNLRLPGTGCPVNLPDRSPIVTDKIQLLSKQEYKLFTILESYRHYLYHLCSPQDDSYDTIVYNSYYQWVPLYLIFLAVIFYMPRCFWLMMEGGLMKFFGKGTTTRYVLHQSYNKIRFWN